MAHRRQLIREAIKAALLGETDAGDRVYETRKAPVKRLDLPAIAVYTLSESVSQDSRATSPRELKREMNVAIEAVVKEGENADDAMDDLALQIERVMHADPTFGGVCGDSMLVETSMDLSELGDQPVGIVILTYAVTYYTGAPEADDVELDDLSTVTVDYAGGANDIVDGLGG